MTRLVLDLACNRVIYFTDDANARLTVNEHVYIREWLRPLPMGMELSNCWDWKLQGDSLSLDLGQVDTYKKSLLEHNKDKTLQFLTDVINYLRKDIQPTCLSGKELREIKYQQAIAGEGDLIESMAQTLGWDLDEVCREIRFQRQNHDYVLIETEKLRELYKEKIFLATSNDEIYSIRDNIAQLKNQKIRLGKKGIFNSTLLVK